MTKQNNRTELACVNNNQMIQSRVQVIPKRLLFRVTTMIQLAMMK